MSAIIRTDVCDEDVLAVLSDLWDVSRGELEQAGKTDPQEIFQITAELVRKASAINLARKIVVDGSTVALVGAIEFGSPGRLNSFFIASQNFKKEFKGVTKLVRDWTTTASDTVDADILMTVSRSTHPERDRWFRLLGYKYQPEASTESMAIFYYTKS